MNSRKEKKEKKKEKKGEKERNIYIHICIYKDEGNQSF